MKYSIEQYNALESNYITEIWYKISYTLKDSIYRYCLHKQYIYSSSNITFKIVAICLCYFKRFNADHFIM